MWGELSKVRGELSKVDGNLINKVEGARCPHVRFTRARALRKVQ